MLIDAADLAAGAEVTADLCIVGAGAAGVTIAHALAGTSLSIALVESGGKDVEDASQALYAGTYSGNVPSIDANYLRTSRFRRYGGSTTFWGGYCRPLDSLDFEVRDWVSDSGWPITRGELEPYYRKASKLLGIGDFDEPALEATTPASPAVLRDASVEERLYQFRYVNIGQEHLGELGSSSRVTLVLHANAVGIVSNSSGTAINHIELAMLGGKRLRARARAFVLATGGIENARLLLASRAVNPKGIGNDRDLVGRYFMEHVIVESIGPLAAWQSVPLGRYRERRPDGTTKETYAPGEHRIAHFLAPAETVLRERRLLSVTAQIASGVAPGDHRFDAFDHALMRATEPIDGREGDAGFVPPQEASLGFACEQEPNPNSRVTLGAELDPLGVPRVDLSWRIGELEIHTIQTFGGLLAGAFGSRRFGRVRVAPTRDEILAGLLYGNHHMGTTRMHADPARGVVDGNCRVHGIENLFIGGSSVFPTSGSANPTYNLLALAFRLADHLQGWLV